MNRTSSYSSSKMLIMATMRTNSLKHCPNRKLVRAMKKGIHSLEYMFSKKDGRERKNVDNFLIRLLLAPVLCYVFLFKRKSREIEFSISSLFLEELLFFCLNSCEEYFFVIFNSARKRRRPHMPSSLMIPRKIFSFADFFRSKENNSSLNAFDKNQQRSI